MCVAWVALAEHASPSTMNINASRRNGKPASCEPCRLNKTKCDHTYPKCDRCRQRGIEDRCFYHPAPLTKPRDEHQKEPQTNTRSGESRSLKRKRTSTQKQYASGPDGALSPTPQQEEKLADAVAADTYSPGYLGPGSYALLLPQDDGLEVPPIRESSVTSESPEPEMTHQYFLNKAMRRELVANVLSVLRHYAAIRELVLWYSAKNEAGAVPASLQVDMVNAMESFVEQHNLRRRSPSTEVVDQILENTGKPLCVPRIASPRDLHKACSGANLRLETIGFLLAIAGRSLSFGNSPDGFSGSGNRGLRARFVDELLSASTKCLTLTPLISTVNDVTVWMYYENFLFTAMICGYSGPPTWRRINHLATQVYAMGLHRESRSAATPTWLAETRRRIFCSSYNHDKTIATFLGRPLRISKRHTDIRPPYDLRDDELTGDPAELDATIARLDPNGWNTKGLHLRASWIRLRYMASQLREEVLDFSLCTIDSKVEQELLDISARIRSSWDSIPPHMRYRKTVWDEGYPSSACLMLVIMHLTHWYNEFMIQKLLDYTPITSNLAMLRVSIDLLSNVLALGAIRDRTYDVHRDLLHCILLFGLPSASVLATALRRQQQTAAPFPPSISRAEIVRMLSVLISHLDASAHLENSGARAGEANYNLCRKASRIFTRVIDQVLDPKQSEVTPTNSEGLDLGIEGEMGLDLFGVSGLEGFEDMGFPGLVEGNAGLEGSATSVDWGALGQWTL